MIKRIDQVKDEFYVWLAEEGSPNCDVVVLGHSPNEEEAQIELDKIIASRKVNNDTDEL